MRISLILMLLLFYTSCFCQDHGLIKLAFSDRSNFHLTTLLGNKEPPVFYVMHKTAGWYDCRFHIDEDLSSATVRAALELDEHSSYNNCYIFRDTALDRLFDDGVKLQLYQLSKSIKPRLLVDTFKVFKLVTSSENAKPGFFFSVTDPVFTKDNQFAFLDITIFKKEKDPDTKKWSAAYFGHTFLMYQRLKGKAWTLVKKINYLVL